MRGAVAVTVTYNSAATVDGLIDSLAGQDGHVARLIVVDNGSTDDTVAQLRARARSTTLPLTVVEGENVGFAAGMARGCALLEEPEPTLIVNPDVRLAPGTVAALLELLHAHPRAGIVTAPLVHLDGAPDSASRRRLPDLRGSMVYAVLGTLTPAAYRYNVVRAPAPVQTLNGVDYSAIEATTGALMLVNPAFRDPRQGVFDRDYWMYGEDLQLCFDARRDGWSVLMAEIEPSVHIKGVSSGLPRDRLSDRHFHAAMYTYYSKNLRRGRLESWAVAGGIAARFAVSRVRARLHGPRRHPHAEMFARSAQ